MLSMLFECKECIAAEDLVRIQLGQTGPGLIVDKVRVFAQTLTDPTIGL